MSENKGQKDEPGGRGHPVFVAGNKNKLNITPHVGDDEEGRGDEGGTGSALSLDAHQLNQINNDDEYALLNASIAKIMLEDDSVDSDSVNADETIAEYDLFSDESSDDLNSDLEDDIVSDFSDDTESLLSDETLDEHTVLESDDVDWNLEEALFESDDDLDRLDEADDEESVDDLIDNDYRADDALEITQAEQFDEQYQFMAESASPNNSAKPEVDYTDYIPEEHEVIDENGQDNIAAKLLIPGFNPSTMMAWKLFANANDRVNLDERSDEVLTIERSGPRLGY